MASIEKLKLVKIAELFSLMSNYQEDENSAQKAFTEFYSRYKQRFWNVCSEVCILNKIGDDKLIKEILESSFREIFIRSSSYLEYLNENDLEKNIESEEEIKILGWLNLIAEEVLKVYLDERNNFNREHLLVDDFKDYQKYLETFQPEIENAKEITERELEEKRLDKQQKLEKKTLRTELAKLRSRDRAILLASMKFKESGRRRSKDEIDYLCKRYKVTYTNLLKISDRKFEKIESRCKGNGGKKAKKGTGTYAGRAKASQGT